MPPEAIDNRGFGRGEPCDTRVRHCTCGLFRISDPSQIAPLSLAGGPLVSRVLDLPNPCRIAAISHSRGVFDLPKDPAARRIHGF